MTHYLVMFIGVFVCLAAWLIGAVASILLIPTLWSVITEKGKLKYPLYCCLVMALCFSVVVCVGKDANESDNVKVEAKKCR